MKMFSRKQIAAALLAGAIITLLMTFTTGSLTLNDESSICPGTPYTTDATFKAGIPNTSEHSTTALASCGELFSKPATSDYVGAVQSTEFFLNLAIWTFVSFIALTLLTHLRGNKKKK